MKIKPIDENTFRTFADRDPGSNIWQTVEMGRLQELEGRSVETLGFYDDEGKELLGAALTAYYPVARFGKMAMISRGPLINWDDSGMVKEAVQAMKSYFAGNGVLYAHLSPYVEYAPHNLDGSVREGSHVRDELVKQLKDLGMEHEGFTVGIDLSRECRWVYMVPLEGKDEDSLLKSFERKTRRSVQKAIKSGCEVRRLSRDELDQYAAILNDTYEKHDFIWRDALEYARNVYDSFHDSGKVEFLGVYLNLNKYEEALLADLKEKEDTLAASQGNSKKMIKRRELAEELKKEILVKLEDLKEMKKEHPEGEILLSAGLFYITKREILCLMSGTRNKYLQFAAPYLMHWEVMKACMANHQDYNLYGCSGDFSESAVDRGVFLFKAGFNGYMSEKIGDFDLPCQDLKYKSYRALKKLMNR